MERFLSIGFQQTSTRIYFAPFLSLLCSRSNKKIKRFAYNRNEQFGIRTFPKNFINTKFHYFAFEYNWMRIISKLWAKYRKSNIAWILAKSFYEFESSVGVVKQWYFDVQLIWNCGILISLMNFFRSISKKCIFIFLLWSKYQYKGHWTHLSIVCDRNQFNPIRKVIRKDKLDQAKELSGFRYSIWLSHIIQYPKWK